MTSSKYLYGTILLSLGREGRIFWLTPSQSIYPWRKKYLAGFYQTTDEPVDITVLLWSDRTVVILKFWQYIYKRFLLLVKWIQLSLKMILASLVWKLLLSGFSIFPVFFRIILQWVWCFFCMFDFFNSLNAYF